MNSDLSSKYEVSVVIPFYKGGRFAKQLTASLESQTFKSFQIIIVDDGKGDGFPELLEAFKSLNLLDQTVFVSTLKGSEGPAKARNLGLSLASASKVAFLDTDDVWFPKFLEKILAAMKKDNSAMLFAQVVWKDEISNAETYLKLPNSLNFHMLAQTCPIQPPAMIVDKTIAGDFRFPDCKHEDYALWLKLIKKVNRIDCIRETLLQVNRVEGSVSSNKNKAMRWHWNVLKSSVEKTFLTRLVLFFMYALNAVLKRKLKVYRPIFLPDFIIQKLP